MEPEDQCQICNVAPIISILSRINQIPHIDTYFFKVRSNIFLPHILIPLVQHGQSSLLVLVKYSNEYTAVVIKYLTRVTGKKRYNKE